MDDSKLVEICSAANPIEAYTLANALEEAGIKAQVVGDYLGMGSGGLPLGQATTPRIWVLKKDEARALEVIDQLESEAENHAEAYELKSDELESNEAGAEEPESDQLEAKGDAESGEESGEAAEESAIPSTSERRFITFSTILGIVGMICIVVGIVFAVKNYLLLSIYSKTAEAKLISRGMYYQWRQSGGDADFPFRGDRSWIQNIWKSGYIYEVNDILYSIELNLENAPPPTITIRYKPENPAESLIKPVSNPFWCLIFGCLTGGFALFLAYQYR